MSIRITSIFLFLIVLCQPFGFCFGADETGMTAETVANSTMPSMPDILNVIEKATSGETDGEPAEWSTPVKLVIVFTVLAIVPSLMAMMTSFTRIVIVLSFVRRALSTQTIPPTIAIMGLAMFLTLYTMAPTLYKMNADAIQPYIAEEMTFDEAGAISGGIIKDFMIRQTRRSDIALFIKIAKGKVPQASDGLPFHVVVPAFIISEFRTAFEMGCLLFIPFLLLDLVIASILLSAGMMMLPPVMISMPFKLILFILIDGWAILAQSLSLSFK